MIWLLSNIIGAVRPSAEAKRIHRASNSKFSRQNSQPPYPKTYTVLRYQLQEH